MNEMKKGISWKISVKKETDQVKDWKKEAYKRNHLWIYLFLNSSSPVPSLWKQRSEFFPVHVSLLSCLLWCNVKGAPLHTTSLMLLHIQSKFIVQELTIISFSTLELQSCLYPFFSTTCRILRGENIQRPLQATHENSFRLLVCLILEKCSVDLL